MKRVLFVYLFSIICLPLLSFGQVSQVRFGSGEFNFLILSDSTSRSVLISDLLPDRSGYYSQVIGTGSWFDQGKNIQARSLLYFNIQQVAPGLKASDIVRAELVLTPFKTGEAENQSYTKICVRRIEQNWQDSSTNWNNQPVAATSDEALFSLALKRRTGTFSLNVTRIFKNMLRYGNYGFQISYPPLTETVPSFSRWFASSRNDESNFRPYLIITLYNESYDLRIPRIANMPSTFNEAVRNMSIDLHRQMTMNGGTPAASSAPPVPVVVDSPPPPKKDN